MTTTAAQAAGATPEKTGTNREPRPFEHRHPHFVKLLPLLTRYRAVMGGMETTEERKAYLPKFPHELDDLYDHRVETTEFLGSSETAVERLTGAVFASPAPALLDPRAGQPVDLRHRRTGDGPPRRPRGRERRGQRGDDPFRSGLPDRPEPRGARARGGPGAEPGGRRGGRRPRRRHRAHRGRLRPVVGEGRGRPRRLVRDPGVRPRRRESLRGFRADRAVARRDAQRDRHLRGRRR